MVELAKRAVQNALQLIDRAGICIFKRGGLITDCFWLAALQAYFNQTALVGIAGFICVTVAEMHLNPGDMLAKAVQTLVNLRRNFGGKLFPAVDIFVGVDLNLHCYFFLSNHRPARRYGDGGGRLRRVARADVKAILPVRC